ncbi:MAG TPA: sigma-70 family RNA polymerase sigma factor, partial [Acidobacteriota bacterium]|nr:sigma-70 family RNA polymerase sigma factor [Acidobacteriota bacterium]
IRSLARQIRGRLSLTIEFEDLESYGRLGLLEASRRFDYKLGVAFKTFAYYRIKGAIYDGLRKMQVISRRKDPRLKFEEAATQLLGSEASRGSAEMRKPTLKEEIQEIQGLVGAMVPIYYLASEILDQLKDPASDQKVEDYAQQSEERAALRSALGKLSKNERSLIESYYFQDCTLEEAASQMGLSKSWASRLHARALAKLKDAMSLGGKTAQSGRTRPQASLDGSKGVR